MTKTRRAQPNKLVVLLVSFTLQQTRHKVVDGHGSKCSFPLHVGGTSMGMREGVCSFPGRLDFCHVHPTEQHTPEHMEDTWILQSPRFGKHLTSKKCVRIMDP